MRDRKDPNDNSITFPLFPQEKKGWRQMFLKDFTQYLNDDEAMARAFNARGSIRDKTKGGGETIIDLNAARLHEVLHDLDNNGENSQYFINDIKRFRNELINSGFTEYDLEMMKPSDILRYGVAV